MTRTEKGFEASPQNWRCGFNLAIYRLAAGNQQGAEDLYRRGESLANTTEIREAIDDLDDYLAAFPAHPRAAEIRAMLAARLAEA